MPHWPIPQALIVDDESGMVEVIAELSRKAGYEVLTAESVNLAIERFTPGVQLVILDIQMPGKDGLDLIRYMSNIGYGGDLVLVSGFDQRILSTARYTAECQGLSVLGALTKPFTAADFRDICAKAGQNQARPAESEAFRPTEEDVLAALENGEIRPFYQPIISLGSSRVTSVEALARWIHPTLGVLPPRDFLGVLLRSGHVDDMTEILMGRALEDLAVWAKEGAEPNLCFNVEASSLNNPAFPGRLQKLVVGHGMETGRVVLEVTERGGISQGAVPLEVLTRVRVNGFKLAIDDFGTGHSTIEQLHILPFNELKLDRLFVGRIGTSYDAGIIVESTIDLAHKLGMQVVAEGIENYEQLEFLGRAGCDEGQGYLIGKPQPADEMAVTLKRLNPVPDSASRART